MKQLATTIVLLLAILTFGSCNKATQPAHEAATKRYHLKGKVISVDKRAKMVNIDGEAIPDFMDAMIMPYPIKPADELDKLSPGDAITADVVVDGYNSWLENIVVTGHSAATTTK